MNHFYDIKSINIENSTNLPFIHFHIHIQTELLFIFQILLFFCFMDAIVCKVVNQFYQTRVIDEFVLRGNAAILKCNLPSFIADFVYVEAWISDDGTEILPNNNDFGRYCKSAVRYFISCTKSVRSESRFPSITPILNPIKTSYFYLAPTIYKLQSNDETYFINLSFKCKFMHFLNAN